MLACLLLLAGLTGCIGGDERLPPANETSPDQNRDPASLTFRPDGTNATDRDSTAPTLTAHTALTGFEGAEPMIGSLPTGELFLQSFDLTLRSQDGGSSWEGVYDYGYGMGVADLGGTWDPMLWTDPVTERVYADHMTPGTVCTAIAWSEDAGESWDRNDHACAVPSVDFQKLGGGPPGPGENPFVQAGQHPTVLYLCYNKPIPPLFIGASVVFHAATHCSMSYDGGVTWPIESRVAGCAWSRPAGTAVGDRCAGAAGVPTVAPDGRVYIGLPGGIDGPSIAVSEDSGLSWTVRAGVETGTWAISAAPNVAFTPDGTLYVTWADRDRITLLARSADGGQSWDGPWRVSPPGVETSVFHALATGADGRVGVAFLGTAAAVDPNTAPDETRWHLYLVASEDAGADQPTFTSIQATPDEDPVQIGPICLGGASCQGARNLLDFIDAAATPDGRFVVAYTDGCTDGCAGEPSAGPGDSRSMETAVAWLEGFSLFGG